MAKRWDTEDGDDLLRYNALDTVATARVYESILAEEDWTSTRCQRLHDVHTRMSVVGGELHDAGFFVYETDADLVNHLGKDWADTEGSELARSRESMAAELTKLHEQRKDALLQMVPDSLFQGTDNHMRALLYQRHAIDGIPCYGLEEPDQWDTVMWTNDQFTTLAVDKEALLRVFIGPATPDRLKDIIAMFWRFKAPAKARSTWVMANEVLESTYGGRDHADWNSAGTETMRWACRLMTLPRAKDDSTLGGELPNMRAMYGTPKGRRLYHWDWKSQELRVLWAISKDKALGEALASGNVYVADAKAWFPSQLEATFGADWKTKDAKFYKKNWENGYRQCKVGHLAAQYMAGAPAMWTQALVQDRNIRFSTMKAIRDMFHKRYYQTVEYAKAEMEFALKHGYSEGRILHGRRYYPAPPAITEACNFPVQRTAGEMGALTMIAIRDALKKYRVPADILTNEHDAGTIDYKDDAQVLRDIKDIVASAARGPWTIDGNAYEMPVDDHTGRSWADACAD